VAALLLWPDLSRAASAEDNPPCQPAPVAELRMTADEDGRVSVPVTLDGHTVNLLVDTGAGISMLSQLAVSTLGLREITAHRLTMELYGGDASHHYVIARNVDLGGIDLHPMPFFIAPDERFRAETSGALGVDFLERYDVELDFANGRLNLFSKDSCPVRAAYWTKGPFARIPFQFDRDRHIKVPVRLDGTEMFAQLDTGAEQTIGSLEDIAKAFGVDDIESITGSDRRARIYRYPFKLMIFEGVEVRNPDILLLPNGISRMPPGERELIIGMNVLHRLHLYIAYGEGALYVTSADAR
jgi:predicted aspartyl protease